MHIIELLHTPTFWTGLMTIIWINVILSGDNAVVIALAARSLPHHQQRLAVMFGAGAAVVLRIILTVFAVTLLALPYLKLVGGLMLFWIAISLLLPGDDETSIKSHDTLFHAIRTILVADLIMSVDNIIAVAAAANGNFVLLVLGLMLSIPLVIFGATMLMNLMERYPAIVTLGAAMIGWVAGEMIIAEPAVTQWVDTYFHGFHNFHLAPWDEDLWAPLAGALLVLVIGKGMALRQGKENDSLNDL